jgi:hypothetical protein
VTPSRHLASPELSKTLASARLEKSRSGFGLLSDTAITTLPRPPGARRARQRVKNTTFQGDSARLKLRAALSAHSIRVFITLTIIAALGGLLFGYDTADLRRNHSIKQLSRRWPSEGASLSG